jgi:ABC-2 type transport system permease protein
VSESSARLAGLRFLRLHQGKKVHSAVGQPISHRLLEIWDRRDVLRMLTERGLRHKYGASVLGYAWSLLEPSIYIAIYFLLLKIFNKSWPMYPLFIGSVILPWQWFAQSVNSSTGTLRKNSRLITSIALPREIYPLADVAMKTVEYVVSLPIIIVVAWAYHAKPSAFLLAFPLAFMLELMLVTGLTLLVSSLNTVLRDIEQGIGLVTRMLFYLTPCLYPLLKLGPSARMLESYNPMVGIVEINRAVWFPAYWTGWRPLWFSVIGAVVVLVLGFSVFARGERAVLKEL